MTFKFLNVFWKLSYREQLLPKCNPRKLGIPKVTSTTIAVKLAHKSRRNFWNFRKHKYGTKNWPPGSCPSICITVPLIYTVYLFVPKHGQCKREQFGTCADIFPRWQYIVWFLMSSTAFFTSTEKHRKTCLLWQYVMRQSHERMTVHDFSGTSVNHALQP